MYITKKYLLWKSEVLIKFDAKIAYEIAKIAYIQKLSTRKLSSVLKRKDVIDCLSKIHTNFVVDVVPIDKAANNVAFICKCF